MGFWKNFFGIEEQQEQQEQGVDIPAEYIESFQNSPTGQIELIEAELFKFEKVYPEGKVRIEQKIQQIRIKIDNGASQLELTPLLDDLNNEYRKCEHIADERTAIDEVKKSIDRIAKLRNLFDKDKPYTEIEEILEKLKGEETYIQSIGSRISEFENTERDKLIAELMKARYHIAMAKMQYFEELDLLDYKDNQSKAMAPFNQSSETEKIYWGNILLHDINQMISDYNSTYSIRETIKRMEERIKTLRAKLNEDTGVNALSKISAIEEISDNIDRQIDQIENETSNDLMDDFKITGLFRNFEFLQLFAKTRNEINRLKEKVKEDTKGLEYVIQELEEKEKKRAKKEEQKIKEIKERENQERKKQEELEQEVKLEREKYKKMTEQDSEVQEQLKQIDSSTFDMKQKYRRMMQFQIETAKKKGLVSKKELMENEGVDFLVWDTSKIPYALQQAEEKCIFISVMLGVDDDKETSVIIVSKDDKEKLCPTFNLTGWGSEYYAKIKGKLRTMVLMQIPEEERIYFCIGEENEKNDTHEYSLYESTKETWKGKHKEILQKTYEKIRNLDNSQSTENIKFHIKLPLGRSMISILDKLREEGIEFYIPPIDIDGLDAKRSEPFYRIYIDRKYLEQYKQRVHPVISNSLYGFVIIGDEEVKISDLVLTGTEFPYDIDKKDKQAEK